MRKNTLLIILFLAICNSIFAQKDAKLYDKGNKRFNEGKLAEAEAFYTEAININPKRDYYFNRGITRLNLKDTLGFCIDMKYLKEINDFSAINLYKQNCFKYDTLSYKFYNMAVNAIKKENYILADTLLSLSINSNHFIDNHFYRGVIRLMLADTSGFCLDMRVNHHLDEASRNNFDTFCKDTIFYKKGFLEISESLTPYYEIRYRPNVGAFYNENSINKTSSNGPMKDMYWFSEDLVGLYNTQDDKQIFTLANDNENNFYIKVKTYIDKNLILNNEVKEVFDKYNITEFKMVLNFISSEKGDIIDVHSSPTKVIKEQINDENDFNHLDKEILLKLKEIIKSAPALEQAYVGEKAVVFKRTAVIKIKI